MKDLDEHTARVLRDHLERDEHDPNAPIQPKRSNGQTHQFEARPRFSLLNIDQLGNLPQRDHLIKGVIDRHAMSLLVGGSNIGKTALAIDVCGYVTTQGEWCGRRTRQGAVAYLAIEGGLGIAERIRARFQHCNLPTHNVPFYVLPEQLNLCSSKDDVKALIAVLAELPPEPALELVVIDTLSQALAGGNENSPDDMGKFVRNVNQIRAATGAHVMVLHHPGKDDSKGARGHSLLRAAVDTELELTRDEYTSILTLRTTKQRDHPTGDAFNFKIVSVTTGVDEDGDPITAPVIEIENEIKPEPTKKPRRRLSPSAQIALQAIAEAINTCGQPAPASNHIPSDANCVTVAIWREYAFNSGICRGDNPAAQRQAWKRAKEACIAVGAVGHWNDLVWLPR